MTEQELKKKIVDVINVADISVVLRRNDIIILADALIAAGYGDVKKAEHRMSVMQLALKNACEIVFSQEIDVEDWDDVIFNYKKEKGIREIGITPNILYDYLKEQAEKELAEEGKEW